MHARVELEEELASVNVTSRARVKANAKSICTTCTWLTFVEISSALNPIVLTFVENSSALINFCWDSTCTCLAGGGGLLAMHCKELHKYTTWLHKHPLSACRALALKRGGSSYLRGGSAWVWGGSISNCINIHSLPCTAFWRKMPQVQEVQALFGKTQIHACARKHVTRRLRFYRN